MFKRVIEWQKGLKDCFEIPKVANECLEKLSKDDLTTLLTAGGGIWNIISNCDGLKDVVKTFRCCKPFYESLTGCRKTIKTLALLHNYKVLKALMEGSGNLIASHFDEAFQNSVFRNDVEMTQYLINNGVDPFRINSRYNTASDIGIQKGNTECVLVILN